MTNPTTEQVKAPFVITDRVRKVFQAPIQQMAQLLIRLGLGANAITLIGFLINVIPAVLIAQGQYLAAGLVFMFSAPLDALDGAVARATGKTTRFGALLDSTLDRYTESLLIGALAYRFALQGNPLDVIVAYAALVGSLMVSYTRARSEGLSIQNRGGYFTREVRMALLVLGLLTGWVIYILWVLAIASQFTVFQRMWHAYQSTRDDGK